MNVKEQCQEVKEQIERVKDQSEEVEKPGEGAKMSEGVQEKAGRRAYREEKNSPFLEFLLVQFLEPQYSWMH